VQVIDDLANALISFFIKYSDRQHLKNLY